MDEKQNDEQEKQPPPARGPGDSYRVVSDMNLDGRYEKSTLEMTYSELLSRSDGKLQVRLLLDEVEFVLSSEYVGNGVLEAQLNDGRRMALIRYSKTLSERFEEAEHEINKRLGRELSEDEKAQQHADGRAPKEVKLTYRCPNCGYPLDHQGDVCPKCVNVRARMWRILKYLVPYWKQAAVGLLLAFALTALGLAPANILRLLIDGPLDVPTILPQQDTSGLRAADQAELFASKKAYRLARENDVNPSVIDGSGKYRLITKNDIKKYLSHRDRFATAAAQELAYRQLVSYKVIEGTGPRGCITERDVEKYAAEVKELPAAPAARQLAFHLGVDLRAVEPRDADAQITKDDVVEASKAGRHRTVGVLVLALLGVFIVRSVLSFARRYLMGSLGAKVVHDIRSQLYRALQRLSLSFYEREHTGRIMSRVTSDTAELNSFVVSGLPNVIIYILTIIGIGTVMMVFHWKLALLTLLATPLMVVSTIVFARRMRVTYRRVKHKNASLFNVLSESISGVHVVRAFGQEAREVLAFEGKSAEFRQAVMGSVKLQSIFNPMMLLLTSLGMFVIYSYGGHLVVREELKLGVLVMFNAYMIQFYSPVIALAELTGMFQSAAVSAERVFGILDTPSQVADATNAKPLEKTSGSVALENVSFAYEKGETILKNINLDVKPGEIIGLVGQTGSGKSTLVKLVARFYDPTKGRMLLDGRDLREVRLTDLRRHIGMVLQDTFLFTGTLRDNIAYGRPEATDEEVILAARAANAHDFIMDMPDAYDTYTGERGVGLSGGERQRIAIARAILKDPAILILDEATSSVDTATEAMIQGALDHLMKGRTTIAIAHRLSTLKNANRLVVLDKGEIIEMGTHEELLAREGGIYRNLVEIQDLMSSSRVKQATPVT